MGCAANIIRLCGRNALQQDHPAARKLRKQLKRLYHLLICFCFRLLLITLS